MWQTNSETDVQVAEKSKPAAELFFSYVHTVLATGELQLLNTLSNAQ